MRYCLHALPSSPGPELGVRARDRGVALIAVGLQRHLLRSLRLLTRSHVRCRSRRNDHLPVEGSRSALQGTPTRFLGYVRYGRFTTCPPKRVLVLGDSVALTMGIQMSLNQEDWGTIVDDAALTDVDSLPDTTWNSGPLISQQTLYSSGPSVRQRSSRLDIRRPQLRAPSHRCRDGMVGFLPARDQRQGLVAHATPVRLPCGAKDTGSHPQPENCVRGADLLLVGSLDAAHRCRMDTQSRLHQRPLTTRSTVSYGRPHGPRPRRISSTSRRTSLLPVISKRMSMVAYAGPAMASICTTVPASNFVHTECGKALQRGVLSMIRQDLMKK